MLSQLWSFVLEGWGQQPGLQAEWLRHQADVQHLVRGNVRKNVHHAVELLAKDHSSLNPLKPFPCRFLLRIISKRVLAKTRNIGTNLVAHNIGTDLVAHGIYILIFRAMAQSGPR